MENHKMDHWHPTPSDIAHSPVDHSRSHNQWSPVLTPVPVQNTRSDKQVHTYQSLKDIHTFCLCKLMPRSHDRQPYPGNTLLHHLPQPIRISTPPLTGHCSTDRHPVLHSAVLLHHIQHSDIPHLPCTLLPRPFRYLYNMILLHVQKNPYSLHHHTRIPAYSFLFLLYFFHKTATGLRMLHRSMQQRRPLLFFSFVLLSS